MDHQQQWRDRYQATAAAGALGTIGAYALARLGRPGDAADAVEEARAIMLSERVGLIGRSVEEPGPDVCVVHVMATVVGGLALVARRAADVEARWLPESTTAALNEPFRTYAAGYDSCRKADEARGRRASRGARALVCRCRQRSRVRPGGAVGPVRRPAARATSRPSCPSARWGCSWWLRRRRARRGKRLTERAAVTRDGRAAEPRRALVVRDARLANSESESAAVLALFPTAPRSSSRPRRRRCWRDGRPTRVRSISPVHAGLDFGSRSAAAFSSARASG